MALIVMIATEGVTSVISGATVSCVRKHHILVFVVADPITAAFGLDQVLGFAAEPTARLVRFLLGW